MAHRRLLQFSDEQIHALLLHCEQRAAHGGENALMDHEIAYILLREADPEHIRVFMSDDVMTIPARMEGDYTVREDRTGPVFTVNPLTGNLHMRYTVRHIMCSGGMTLHARRRAVSDEVSRGRLTRYLSWTAGTRHGTDQQ